MYVKNLLLANDGIATTKPKNIEMMIETAEIKTVVVKPLSKNFRFVNPSTLLGDKINQPNSWPLQEVSGKTKSKKSIFFNLKLIKN